MQAQLDTEAQLLQEISDNPGAIRTYLEGMVPSLLSFLVQVIVAIIVLLIGSRIIKFLLKLIRKSLDRSKVEAGVVTFLCSLVKYSLYFVLAMIILAQFGVTTSSVVAVLGSAGLTLGLALQGSLSNFAGGVLILLLKPFVVGDYIIDGATGQEGTVSSITIFYTKLLTVDNRMILIPNGTLSNSSITNVTQRRIDLLIGVSYEANLAKTKQVLLDVVKSEDKILPGEPVDVYVSELADSSVQMGVRAWVKTEDYWPIRWKMTEDIKNALDANGISIPYPQMDVTVAMQKEE